MLWCLDVTPSGAPHSAFKRKKTEKRDRGEIRGRGTPILRKRLLRPQSVACAEVQAGAFKALAGLAPVKTFPNCWALWSVFKDGSNETRKNACIWRSSCRARHNVAGDMSSELCRRSTLRVCRGVFVTAVSISLVRRHFSGRDWSGALRRRCLSFALMLSSEQSDRIARISRGFRSPRAPLAQLSDVLHCPVNATTHDAKVLTREG